VVPRPARAWSRLLRLPDTVVILSLRDGRSKLLADEEVGETDEATTPERRARGVHNLDTGPRRVGCQIGGAHQYVGRRSGETIRAREKGGGT